MKIKKALYGGVDCIDVVSDKVVNGKLLLRVNNNIIGDPLVGKLKTLDLEWEDMGITKTRSWTENSLCFVNIKNKKLGLFYSNNNNNKIKKTINLSLNTIKEASFEKAEVFTCFWEKQENNPFIDIPSWYRSSSHLNQTIQILQLLYTTEEIGGFEYVSFLEHDVLYPKDYFDYPNFPKGSYLCNTNYIGMNPNGWQESDYTQKPMHQITMRFDDSIKHLEKILKNALLTNSGIIEPYELNLIEWKSINPSVHVNHGSHFTSHFNTYKKESTEVNSYWGNIKNYKYLFEQ